MIEPKKSIPAIDCPLSGAYLIEASAGTGKTWTLTGIILRLLIEKNIAPERIVATTFTRAAAAEMKERLYESLSQFYEVCLWAKHHESFLFSCEKDDQIHLLDKDSKNFSILSDAIYRYLLLKILTQSPKELNVVLNRVQIILGSIDKIFIGTLDSLAQKWLKEFGQDSSLEIIKDPRQEINTIIHDELRKIHSQMYYDQPILYQVMDKTIFTDIDKMVNISKSSLDFFTAEINPINTNQNNDIENILRESGELIKSINISDFDMLFVDKQTLDDWGFKKNGKLTKSIIYLKEMLQLLKNNEKSNIYTFQGLTDNHVTLLQNLTKDKISGAFNKKHDKQVYNSWNDLPFDPLIRLGELYQNMQKIAEDLSKYIAYVVANKLRKTIADFLEKSNQTTFFIQMNKLLGLISGKKGEKIAQHIRYLYPVALIDETQDINGEQVKMLYEIYLSPNAKKMLFEDTNKGFLLCVGDPKQAIYRFRGGDVANYNYLKSLGMNTSFSLDINRRSSLAIVNTLNYWFDSKNQSNFSNLGEDIFYHHITAFKEDPAANWIDNNHAIEFLHLAYNSPYDKLYAIALHINTLLQSDKKIKRDDNFFDSIKPSDIAILLDSNKDILIMQSHLKEFNIDTVINYDQTVFDTQAASDIFNLFMAAADPSDKKIMMALTGIYRYSLKESQIILKDDKKRNEFLIYLKNILIFWQKNSIAAAFNFAFEKPALIDCNFWHYLATYKDSDRYLTDLWQIIDIMGTWQIHPLLLPKEFESAKKNSEYQRISLPSESGVYIMTMHKSKGLEFNIVYTVGMQKPLKESKQKIYPYTDDNIRKLSVVSSKEDNDDYYYELDKKEGLNEKKRLGYVALTRAAEQLYIIVQDIGKANTNAMSEWGFFDGKNFCIPDRLKDKVSFTSFDDMIDCKNYILSPYLDKKMLSQNKVVTPWESIYKQKQFLGILSTSFTNLNKRLEIGRSNHDLLGHDDDIIVSDIQMTGDIRSRFMRGRLAGTYLHRILQKVTQEQDIKKSIHVSSKELGLSFDELSNHQIYEWIFDIVNGSFLSSNAKLVDLQKKQAEFGFLMALSEDFDPLKLADIFEKYSDKSLPNMFFENKDIFGFLKGEIDLLYFYKDKYYVVDYKSNYLANDCDYYTQELMSKSMTEEGYWLQAAIYQLALHRLLKYRVEGYVGNEKHYLGGVEYVFLRGVDESNRYGRLVWDIPLELIIELDKLFG